MTNEAFKGLIFYGVNW